MTSAIFSTNSDSLAITLEMVWHLQIIILITHLLKVITGTKKSKNKSSKFEKNSLNLKELLMFVVAIILTFKTRDKNNISSKKLPILQHQPYKTIPLKSANVDVQLNSHTFKEVCSKLQLAHIWPHRNKSKVLIEVVSHSYHKKCQIDP